MSIPQNTFEDWTFRAGWLRRGQEINALRKELRELRSEAQAVLDADDWYESQCSCDGPDTMYAFEAVWDSITRLRLAMSEPGVLDN